MDLILAIEPDDAQAAVLARMLPDRVGAELVVAASVEAAATALDCRVPDVLLVGRDAPAAEVDRLVAALSSSGSAPQRLPVPELRMEEEEAPRRSWRLPFGRARQAAVAEGWDPTLFAEQVATCLDRARRQRAASPLAPSGDPVDLEPDPIPDPTGACPVPAPTEPEEGGWDETVPPALEIAAASSALVPVLPEFPTPAYEGAPGATGWPDPEAGGAGDAAHVAWEWPSSPAEDVAHRDAGEPADPRALSEESFDAAHQPPAVADTMPVPADTGPSRDVDWWPIEPEQASAGAGAVVAPFEWPAHVDTAQEPAPPAPPEAAADLAAFDPEPGDPSAASVPALRPLQDDGVDPLGLNVLDVSTGDDGFAAFRSESALEADFGADLERVIRELGIEADPAFVPDPAFAPDDVGAAAGSGDPLDALVTSLPDPTFELLPTLGEDADNPFASEADPDGEEFTLEFPEDADGDADAEATASPPADEASGWQPEGMVDPEFHAAELALVEVRAEARLAAEVERVRAEAAAEHVREVARLEAEAAAAREAAVREAREAAEAEARAALARELAAVRGEAEEKLVSELARVRAEAAQSLADQIGQTRAEADQMLEAELARAQTEAEVVRLAALEEARIAAEGTAARALAAEVERVREESDARLEAELARMRAEAEQERFALEQARRQAEAQRDQEAHDARVAADLDAAQRFAAEVERVKAEAETRLAEELARLEQQVQTQRRAEDQARADAEQARDAASLAAPFAAETAAARALDLEIAQVRAEAEARLQAELAQVRQEAEDARRARDEAERRAEEARDVAAREARQAAQDAAARTVADESARMREEAEARLAAETERARREAEARLSDELAAFTADAERRRHHEIQELRRQMAQLRDAAMHQELVRPGDLASSGGYIAPWEPPPPARPSRLLTSPLPRKAAGAAVVLAALSFVIDLPAVVRAGALFVADRVGIDLGWDGDAHDDLGVPILPPESPAQVGGSPPPRTAASGRPASAVVAPTRASGTLTVHSYIPLEIYDGTRRVGTSDGPVSLAPGWHELRLVSNRYNYREEIVVEIRARESAVHSVALPTGLLRVRSAPGADVLVDGRVVGRAPFVELDVPLGTREVVVRHPELGVRRTTVEIRYQLPSEVILPLDRALDGPPATPQLPPLSRRPAR